MLILKEASRMTNQEAWDTLINFEKNCYGRYKKDRPEIFEIKTCMQVLDKCPDVNNYFNRGK
jgi:hypothetical protein